MSMPLLNIWTGYSLLRSTWPIERGLERMAQWGYRDVGICDVDSMAGVQRFDAYARGMGLRPWIGVTRSVLTPAGTEVVQLFALSPAGYRALCRPPLWEPLPSLEAWGHSDLLVVASAALLELAWRDGWHQTAGQMVEGVLPGSTPSRSALSGQWPWIPMWPVRFLEASGRAAYEILIRIGGGTPLADAREVPHPQELVRAYPAVSNHWWESLAPGSVLPSGEFKIPHVSANLAEEAGQLRQIALNGLAVRYTEPQLPAARERLDQELRVIHQLGFSGYFLMVWEIVRHARTAGIRVGPGRGSAAGSIVAYCLGITAINPLKDRLIFERFLNPERKNLPDIDLDVDYARRGELLPFLRRRFGADRVAQISAFGTLGARAVMRDVGKALGLSGERVQMMMEKLNLDPKRPLLAQVEQAHERLAGSLRETEWLQLALELEGLPRHASIHAAGIIISPDPLWNWIPCVQHDDGWVSQMEMASVESLGLVKLDILGLRTLHVLDQIESRAKIPDSFATIPEDDPKTLQLLARGDTDGVFQLDGRGVRDLLRQMHPRHVGEIMDVVALYRPGPMDAIGEYLRRRDDETWAGADAIAEICRDTYGVMVYQEQLMGVVRALAGYSWAQADIFRRAISKKDRALVQTLEQDLLRELTLRGMAPETARSVFAQILAFADYGFNRSHAAAYGRMAYYLAYLKAHFPLEFWSAELSSLARGDRLQSEITEMVGSGIPLLLPEINRSEWGFLPEENALRSGWGVVRGLPRDDADRISREREVGGPFRDFADYWDRLGSRLDVRSEHLLQRCGSLDALNGDNRGGQQLSWFEEPAVQTRAAVPAVECFGWPWPVACGPIYIQLQSQVQWKGYMDVVGEWAQRHPGPVPLVVAVSRGQGRQLPLTVSSDWTDLEELRSLPGVLQVRRRVEKVEEVRHEFPRTPPGSTD